MVVKFGKLWEDGLVFINMVFFCLKLMNYFVIENDIILKFLGIVYVYLSL